MNPSLYAVYLGGRASGANIELHDVVFVAGESLKACFSKLKEKWFGSSENLHIDAYMELKLVDSYEIFLAQDKPILKPKLKLYFVNFGAYRKEFFGEVHESKFYVGTSRKEVLVRAKNELCAGLNAIHCDDNIIVDDIFAIDMVDNFYVNLRPSNNNDQLIIKHQYIKL